MLSSQMLWPWRSSASIGKLRLGLDRRDLANPPAMALLVAERGAQEGARDLDRQLWSGDPLAEAQHIGIVMLDGLVRGVRIAREERPRAADLVGRDARAGAEPQTMIARSTSPRTTASAAARAKSG